MHAESGAEIGDARTIVSIVKADFDKQERELTIGDVVRQDEVIEVSNDGKGEFRLNDDTKLALGPGARMVLDKFVYDSDKKAGTIVLDLTKGAFRFITGVAIEADVSHPHAERLDHRARHHLRHVHSARQQRVVPPARRGHRGDRRQERLPRA